ncbi:MAG: hypothetical protein QOH70_668 [Blastocatellia bacterium]|jgi:hypothetical protein|nr:hypothetical protein [Blastocatellia bacterium]
MNYTVVPFTANIVRGQGATEAADQLSQMINHYAGQGMEYVRLESVETIITTRQAQVWSVFHRNCRLRICPRT